MYKKEREFALVFGVLFTLISLFPLLSDRSILYWALFSGVFFIAGGFVFPVMFVWPSRLWLLFGDLLHKLTNPIIMGLMFFLIVTPIGILMRILGKDLLRLAKDRDSRSYWIGLPKTESANQSMKNQF